VRKTLKKLLITALLLASTAANATIGVGAVGTVAVNGNNQRNGATTGAVTTAASGSSFEVIVFVKTVTRDIAVTVTDSKGNCGSGYTQIGTTIDDTSTQTIYRFLCAVGASGYVGGGSGHTATATFTTSIVSSNFTTSTVTSFSDSTQTTSTSGQWNGVRFFETGNSQAATITTQTITPFTVNYSSIAHAPSGTYYLPAAEFNVVLLEITGGVTSGSLLDQQQGRGGFLTAPWSSSASTGITLTGAANSELLVTCATSDNTGTLTWSETGITGTTTQASFSNGSAFPNQITYVVATRVVTTSGPWKATWTDTVGGSNDFIATLDSFFGAAAAVNSGPKLSLLGVGP
jgi:hypothetical protein